MPPAECPEVRSVSICRRADPKPLPFADRFRASSGLVLGDVNRRAGRGAQPFQIGDVIGMRVREQDELDRQTFARSLPQHLGAIGAGIEGRRFACRRIPEEIGVYRHVAVVRVEGREARRDRGFPPASTVPLASFDQGLSVEAEHGATRLMASSSNLPSRNFRTCSALNFARSAS